MRARRTMRAIVSSDWHLDAVTAGVPRYEEIERSVSQAVQCAIENEVNAFLFLGDLCDYDSVHSFRAVTYAAQVAAYLQNQGVITLWLAGNHDTIEDGHGTTVLSPLRALADIVAESASIVTIPTAKRDYEVAALPYASGANAYDAEEFVREWSGSKPDLVISHLSLIGITPGSETHDFARGKDHLLPLKAIRECWGDVPIFQGHYHRRQVFEGVNVVGSLARLTFGEEENEPSYSLVEI